jgi:hypothetical protein
VCSMQRDAFLWWLEECQSATDLSRCIEGIRVELIWPFVDNCAEKLALI